METTNNFKPILFSTEMVQAILAGRKTQTRRIVKPQPNYFPYTDSKEGHEKTLKNYIDEGLKNGAIKGKYHIGDILWVRETFCDVSHNLENENCFLYKADFLGTTSELVKWKPSLFMPKEAARIFLKVTNIRCERLQDISEEDAITEGIAVSSKVGSDGHYYYKDYNDTTDWPEVGWMHASTSFETLWQSINAKKHPWESNPWVWVYEFERIEKPSDFN